MPSPRLLAFAFLAFAATTAAAQSSGVPTVTPAPQARDSRTQIPAIRPAVRPATPKLSDKQVFENTLHALIAARAAANPSADKPGDKSHLLNSQEIEPLCYALRTYQFTPSDATGATTYKDQTTCVPAHSASAMIVVGRPK